MSVAPDGRRMLRIEARNAEVPIERKPSWIRTTAKMGPQYAELSGLVRREGLHTVCQEAGCPNIFECWEDREATFLIGGEECTRRCDFCQIHTGRPQPLDRDEPRRVASSVAAMGLRYATVTGVARDDLPDEGAWLYAETVRAIHAVNAATGVEILVPDFSCRPELLGQVFDAAPEVFAHNLETVPRVFRRIRPAFSYEGSLGVLAQARAAGMVTKSNLILGMGETRAEVSQALADLQRRRLRPAHDHAVPQALGDAPPHRAVGAPGGVRRAARRGRRPGVRRGHGRTARALLVPRRSAVGPGDDPAGSTHPRGAGPPGRRGDGAPGGRGAGGPRARLGVARTLLTLPCAIVHFRVRALPDAHARPG